MHTVSGTQSRLARERGMGELKDPAKHGAHAQRLQELRAKGLAEGGALRDRAGSTTRASGGASRWAQQ